MHAIARLGATLALAATATVFATASRAQTVDAFGTALKTWATKEKIDRAFVVVRHGGKVVYQFALGGVDPAQPVHLASLSKAITATCAATLVRDGKLSFDTPLSSALAKFFAANGKPADSRTGSITLGQLLTHRSGFGGKENKADPATGSNLVNYVATHKAGDPPAPAYISLIFKAKLVRDPGAAYDYSNAGYLAAGSVIEEAAGKPYATYCADAVLTPLGATGGLDPRWGIMAPYGGWRLSAENYLRFLDIFDPANPTLGKTAAAFLFSPDGKATSPDGGAWYSLGTNIRRSGQGYNTWHWGEWRYAIVDKSNPLSTDFNTFAVRVADGTAWFAYVSPSAADGAPKNDLDAALFNAYRAVKAWP